MKMGQSLGAAHHPGGKVETLGLPLGDPRAPVTEAICPTATPPALHQHGLSLQNGRLRLAWAMWKIASGARVGRPSDVGSRVPGPMIGGRVGLPQLGRLHRRYGQSLGVSLPHGGVDAMVGKVLSKHPLRQSGPGMVQRVRSMRSVLHQLRQLPHLGDGISTPSQMRAFHLPGAIPRCAPVVTAAAALAARLVPLQSSRGGKQAAGRTHHPYAVVVVQDAQSRPGASVSRMILRWNVQHTTGARSCKPSVGAAKQRPKCKLGAQAVLGSGPHLHGPGGLPAEEMPPMEATLPAARGRVHRCHWQGGQTYSPRVVPALMTALHQGPCLPVGGILLGWRSHSS